MKPHVPITETVFEAHLQCEMKAFLLLDGVDATDPEIDNWRQRLAETYKAHALERLCASVSKNEIYQGTPSLRALRRQDYGLLVDPEIALPEIQARPHAVERVPVPQGGAETTYRPIRFSPSEKLTASERLLAAFDALALSRLVGRMPVTARIIHGSDRRSTAVQLPRLIKDARSLVDKFREQCATTTPPSLALNKHCPECQFRSHCRRIAVEKDDLSLLTTLSEKERRKLNRKGITTIAQLSCTYRPRRRSARKRATAIKHEPALKALAIQANRIHVVDTPTFAITSGAVYLDVEGVPDREFYYLIGMRYRSGDEDLHLSFWADDPSAECDMWRSFVRALSPISDVRLIHYGSYETQFLKRMKERYCEVPDDIDLVDRLIATSTNLLSLTYAHIYFPTYSNGLKEIAGYLGFGWSKANASGLHALMWRSEWGASRDPSLKQRLITYNAEDCAATQRVAEIIGAIISGQPISQYDVGTVDALPHQQYPLRFHVLNYALPDFKLINEAAYWDYQRTRVYVRSSRRINRSSKTATKRTGHRLPINKSILVQVPRPSPCRRCSSNRLYKNGLRSYVVYDLRISPSGIRRWTIQYKVYRYQCWVCKAGYNAISPQEKYGPNLKAYAIYQMIELRVPQRAIAHSFETLFGIRLKKTSINNIKINSAKQLQPTYDGILQQIVRGKLVHADETRVTVEGQTRYVWVFTNLEQVAYVYSDSREASTVQDVLRDFRGVLVSDFYVAYDSIGCLHQKCLIHLLRDINEDVLNQPFNDEMAEVAQRFAGLMKPIVETIDRFGLRAWHLGKHRREVDRFYRALELREFRTEVAIGYKKRFEKHRTDLFTFLEHDDVPWNNNNAEHAIKAFARLRNMIDGVSTPKGIRDYLVLLSVCETCKYKGLNFLDFLRSGESDVDTFAAHSGRARYTTRTPKAKSRGGDQKAAHIVGNGLT